MKKLLIGGGFVIVIFIMALNTGMLAEQAEQWVKANPKDPHAPKVLFFAARYCDILGDNTRAQKLYGEIYDQYPENSSICAEALFDEAANKVSTSAATKAYAVPILDTVINQYPSEDKWVQKAKALKDEVTYVR